MSNKMVLSLEKYNKNFGAQSEKLLKTFNFSLQCVLNNLGFEF